jgi:hypothetical protein
VSCGSVTVRAVCWQKFLEVGKGCMCCGCRSRGLSASPHVVAMMPGVGMIGSGTSTSALDGSEVSDHRDWQTRRARQSASGGRRRTTSCRMSLGSRPSLLMMAAAAASRLSSGFCSGSVGAPIPSLRSVDAGASGVDRFK